MVKAVLVVSYARVKNTIQLVETAIAADVSKIYVAIDGPRDNDVKQIQDNLIEHIRKLQISYPNRITIWRRTLNMKSGASVISGLDWVFSVEEEVCILEDDLEIDADFFKFINFGISQMQYDSDLLMVAGSNPFTNSNEVEFGFVNYPVSWGWATNRKNWAKIRSLIFQNPVIRLKIGKFYKNLYWNIGKERSLLGRVDAWDIPLASEMYKTKYYTLLPPTNLVSNIGFDLHASHTTKDTWPLGLPRGKLMENFDSLSVNPNNNSLNELFEKRIYKIGPRHIFSWVLHVLLDRIRYGNQRATLSETVAQEDFPSV
jgi:hypothetical protein